MSIKVLIIEESSYQRILFSEMLLSQKEIDVVNMVKKIDRAIESFETHHPDVLILDFESFDLDNLATLQSIMDNIPIPKIILISPKSESPELKQLLSKAFDIIVKPPGIWEEELPKIKKELITKVKLASKSKLGQFINNTGLNNKNLFIHQSQKIRTQKKLEIEKPKYNKVKIFDKPFQKIENTVIVMGASVGGPKTLEDILEKIPKDFLIPILVVQHLDHFFIRQFTIRLKQRCSLKVVIGKNAEKIRPGIIYIAPGDKHMEIINMNGKASIRIYDGELVNFCRPSVDVLFYSAAQVYKNKTLGILLTGMGKDGVDGLKVIKQEGGQTIAESEETSVLYGMPKVAAMAGAADFIVPNYRIKEYMIRFAKKHN